MGWRHFIAAARSEIWDSFRSPVEVFHVAGRWSGLFVLLINLSGSVMHFSTLLYLFHSTLAAFFFFSFSPSTLSFDKQIKFITIQLQSTGRERERETQRHVINIKSLMIICKANNKEFTRSWAASTRRRRRTNDDTYNKYVFSIEGSSAGQQLDGD